MQVACWRAELTSLRACRGRDWDGDEGERQLGVEGLCRQELATQLQPLPLVRNVSPVLSDHCFFLDSYVKFPDFKMLITDSN